MQISLVFGGIVFRLMQALRRLTDFSSCDNGFRLLAGRTLSDSPLMSSLPSNLGLHRPLCDGNKLHSELLSQLQFFALQKLKCMSTARCFEFSASVACCIKIPLIHVYDCGSSSGAFSAIAQTRNSRAIVTNV